MHWLDVLKVIVALLPEVEHLIEAILHPQQGAPPIQAPPGLFEGLNAAASALHGPQSTNLLAADTGASMRDAVLDFVHSKLALTRFLLDHQAEIAAASAQRASILAEQQARDNPPSA